MKRLINESEIDILNRISDIQKQISSVKTKIADKQKQVAAINNEIAREREIVLRFESQVNSLNAELAKSKANDQVNQPKPEVEKSIINEPTQQEATKQETKANESYMSLFEEDDEIETLDDETNLFYVYIEDEDGTFIGKIYLDSKGDKPKWREKILNGENKSFGVRTYLPKLSKEDIIEWLLDDYEFVEEIQEEDLDEYISILEDEE